MKNLIYINACMKSGSRTQRIATPVIEELSKKYKVETIDLRKNIYPVVDNYILEDRNQGIVPPEHVSIARKIAAADRIVIAAPFWEMELSKRPQSFLREHVSLRSDLRQQRQGMLGPLQG